MPIADPIERLKYDRERNRSSERKEYFKKRYKKLISTRVSSGNSLGYQGEEIALQVLKGSSRIGRPTDLTWEGKLVEVKTAIKRRYFIRTYKTGKIVLGATYCWKFYLKQIEEADIFIFICKGLDKRTEHIFLIPKEVIKVKNFRIAESKVSFYLKYRLTS